ncbi:hypothetical protein ACFQ7J_27350 [Streptomyces sp. NPDC056501]|uniref:hypothetical protein n=1 Tax=Streptomyces sp. NPDC056501 TaxID=3345841 RepID=UPI0036876CAB
MTVVPLYPAVRHDYAADETPAPIVALHQAVAELDRPRQSEYGEDAAFQAVLTADAVLVGSFRATLQAAVATTSWTGYPPVDGPHHTACAVTYLGSADSIRGWWLHYTQRHDQLGDPIHVLTLIAPCACGTYLHADIPHEDALIVMLDELNTPPGPPSPATTGCASDPRATRTKPTTALRSPSRTGWPTEYGAPR